MGNLDKKIGESTDKRSNPGQEKERKKRDEGEEILTDDRGDKIKVEKLEEKKNNKTTFIDEEGKKVTLELRERKIIEDKRGNKIEIITPTWDSCSNLNPSAESVSTFQSLVVNGREIYRAYNSEDSNQDIRDVLVLYNKNFSKREFRPQDVFFIIERASNSGLGSDEDKLVRGASYNHAILEGERGYDYKGGIKKLYLTPDNKLIVALAGHKLVILNPQDEKVTVEKEIELGFEPDSIIFSPQGDMLLIPEKEEGNSLTIVPAPGRNISQILPRIKEIFEKRNRSKPIK